MSREDDGRFVSNDVAAYRLESCCVRIREPRNLASPVLAPAQEGCTHKGSGKDVPLILWRHIAEHGMDLTMPFAGNDIAWVLEGRLRLTSLDRELQGVGVGFNRRLSLQRRLKEELLECQEHPGTKACTTGAKANLHFRVLPVFRSQSRPKIGHETNSCSLAPKDRHHIYVYMYTLSLIHI